MSNDLINIYEILPKHLQTKSIIDKKTNMKIGNGHIIFVGGSGSGKTSLLVNMIRLQTNVWNHITLITPNSKEPLYMFMKEKIPEDQFTIIEDLKLLPKPEEYINNGTCLIIFDDLVCEKNSKPIEEYFIRSRKVGNLKGGSITCAYLTQSWFQTPITLRRNCAYIIIKELCRKQDALQIIKDFSLTTPKDKLLDAFEKYTNGLLNFIMIDTRAPQGQKIRHNFNEILNL